MPHGTIITNRAAIESRTPESRGPALILDLRRFPIGRRNEPVFSAFRQLRDGFDIVVVNDLDSRGLIADMAASFGESFITERLGAEAGLWHLRIARSPENSASRSCGNGAGRTAPPSS